MNTRRWPAFPLNRVTELWQLLPGAGNGRPEVSERRHLTKVLETAVAVMGYEPRRCESCCSESLFPR